MMARQQESGEKCFMSELGVSATVYACVIGGALFGVFMRRVLPPAHMSEESRQIVNVAIGLIATLAALVLGLLVASAKSSFDARIEEVKHSAAKIIVLDRNLRHYGAETRDVRETLRNVTQQRIDRTWGEHRESQQGKTGLADDAGIEQVQARLWQLTPGNEMQRWLHARALSLASDLEQARWILVEDTGSSIPTPFLVVLVFWLTVIFASLGMFAPRNGTVYAVMFVCALSVSTAIFLILEMDQPYEGILQISSAPLKTALEEMKLKQ
jgi:hypothetical protein